MESIKRSKGSVRASIGTNGSSHVVKWHSILFALQKSLLVKSRLHVLMMMSSRRNEEPFQGFEIIPVTPIEVHLAGI